MSYLAAQTVAYGGDTGLWSKDADCEEPDAECANGVHHECALERAVPEGSRKEQDMYRWEQTLSCKHLCGLPVCLLDFRLDLNLRQGARMTNMDLIDGQLSMMALRVQYSAWGRLATQNLEVNVSER